MKKLSRLVLGVACVSMLASCAQSVSAEEAKKIANDNWTLSKVNSAGYSKAHVVVKCNDASQNSESDITGAGLTLVINAMLVANVAAVNAAAGVEGVSFKADGTALEFSYKDSDGVTWDYKTNEVGLTTYSKEVRENSWVTTTYTWSK